MRAVKYQNLKFKRKIQLDRNIIDLPNESVWLCGGAIRTLIDQKKPNDYDLFFKNKESALITELKLENLGYKKIFECPAGELTSYLKNGIKVQIIKKRYYSSIVECISTFDIHAACAGFDGEYIYFMDEFITNNIKKVVSINILTYPVATISRLYKYKNYGFYVSDSIIDVVEMIYRRDENIIDLGLLYVD